VFLFRWGGKTKEMGLGSLNDITLSEARRRRQTQVEVLARGDNPIEVRERERAAAKAAETAIAPRTFADCAAEVIKVKGPKSELNKRKWLKSMQVEVGALARMYPRDIETAHVQAALKPHWHRVPATADYMRQRIELVLDYAHVVGLIPRPWSNPARWDGHLEFVMERRDDRIVKSRPALPFKEAAAFMLRLRGSDGRSDISRWAAEWAILTATRSQEVRGARWEEIDREAKVWTVPGERMKMKRRLPDGGLQPFRVPLSDQALALLDRIAPPEGVCSSPYLFPGGRRDQRVKEPTVSRASLWRVVEGIAGDDTDASPHGFRSTFKDWSREVARVDDILSEECLAHVIGGKVRRAYARSDNLENRRPIMQAWADFLDREWKEEAGPTASSANVVHLADREAA
jgi:integrase